MSSPRMFVLLASLVVTPAAVAQTPVANLITNGDFTLGNTGFTSSYVYHEVASTSPNTVFDQGTYTIAPNLNSPLPVHPSPGLPNYYDHTTGDATGSFMIINGSTSPNMVFWSTSADVQPNTFYTFSLWLSVWNNGSNNLPQVQISFNGVNAMIAIPPVPLGTWTNFTMTWFSGDNSNVHIAMQDNVLDYGGNDFGLDDVSFTIAGSAVPEPGTLALISFALLTAGGYRYYQRRTAAKKLAAG